MDTKEYLLQPRYLVIANYPGSHFSSGVILHKTVHGWDSLISNPFPKGSFAFKQDPSFYPDIFRELEWWEFRSEEEMPDFIHLNQITVYEVEKHFTSSQSGRKSFRARETKNDYPYDISQPADIDEWAECIKKKS